MKSALPGLALLAIALAGCGTQGSHTRTAPNATASAPPSASGSPSSTTPLSAAARSHASARTHGHLRRPAHPPHARTAVWQAGALATAGTFVQWFDRWLAGESTARQAPDVTRGYAAKLRATVNNVPPAAKGRVAAIVHLIPAAMPPTAAHPREACVYTAARSQGTVIQFTVEERRSSRRGRWLVYNLYQGT
jgi:hypothetical protein